MIPAGNYIFKVNNRNTRARCEICSKITIKNNARRRSGVFVVNFELWAGKCQFGLLFTSIWLIFSVWNIHFTIFHQSSAGLCFFNQFDGDRWSDNLNVTNILKDFHMKRLLDYTQLKFTCSKSTIETLEKGVKYVQIY